MQRRDQTRPCAGLETRCPAFGVYASCPKLFLGRLVGPYAYVYGSCPCRQNQRQMQSLHCLPSDLNIRKECINFIFNEVPDRVSTNCQYERDLFSNKAQFDTGFSAKLKLKNDAFLTILDPTVMSHHTSVSNCFYYVIIIALSVIKDRLICTEYLCVFNLLNYIQKSEQRIFYL
ncbi:hypothetical protein DPX16_9002 [Anabarilius grahami]|uniref:Uncharacterized protein n=1 Tax=Anabarilius grahami TaxID=495550 RepID=A0A3N0XCZ0_ANAGA|nr:hypothetical protein DPX16_9002 [Anabarilius grahami]